MKINLGTIVVTNEERLAINKCVGMKGMATRQAIKAMMLDLIEGDLEGALNAATTKQEDKR